MTPAEEIKELKERVEQRNVTVDCQWQMISGMRTTIHQLEDRVRYHKARESGLYSVAETFAKHFRMNK